MWIIKYVITTLLVISFWCNASWAKELATPQLKLNEAIDLTLKNSESVKKSSLDIDKAEEKRGVASDKLKFTPVIGESYDPAVEAAWYGLLSADLSWQMSKKSYSTEEDRMVLDTCQKYWNVQKALANVRSKELAVSRMELSMRRVQAMVRLGMTPPESPGAGPALALTGAEKDLATAKSDLVTAQNGLNSAYEVLNQLIGLMPQDRPVLAEDAVFEPIKVDDLEASVQRALDSSPKVWQAEQSVTLSDYAYELGFATGQYKEYKVRTIEQDQARLDALSARDAVKLLTRSLYYSARNLEEGRLAAEKSVDSAAEALRVAKLQFELGMITRENLVQREEALALAKLNLLSNTVQHAYAVLAFQKPWAATASGT